MKKIIFFCTFLLSIFLPINTSDVYAAEDITFSNLNAEALKNYFSSVHFSFGGNDFPGGFIWTSSKNVNVTINAGTESKTCKKQIAGYYYNASRGNRLRPLDPATLASLSAGDASYSGLVVEGGIYTSCEGDPYGRYGQIKYSYKGVDSYLIAGVKYDYTNSTYIPAFSNSFINLDNKIPIGYIYDTYGGIGFVGGKMNDVSCNQSLMVNLNSGDKLDDLISLDNAGNISLKNSSTCDVTIPEETPGLETMRGISIAGNASLSKSLDDDDRRNIKGNTNSKSLIQSTNITVGQITNSIKKSATDICRGKENQNSSSSLDFSEDIVCVNYDDYDTGNIKELDLSSNNYNGKTIVIINGNLVLKGEMTKDKHLDLFIDKGNLYLSNLGSKPTQSFDANGYPIDNGGVSLGYLLQGNIMVNGLILGYDYNSSKVVEFDHRLFLHGKLSSLNTPTTPQAGRIKQVENIPASKAYAGFIALENVFTWFCDPGSSLGKDGVDCGGNDGSSFMTPLYLIDQKYSSNLLK